MIKLKTPVQIYADLKHEFGLPAYETLGAAGMDVRANEKTVIRPYETALVKTGLYVAIPEGFELQVRPRSGMSLKTFLRITNAPGTIDSDYRGEICIIMQNVSAVEEAVIQLGDRIAQLVLNEVPQVQWIVASSLDTLSPTGRGVGGFGSTGIQGIPAPVVEVPGVSQTFNQAPAV